MVWVCSCSASNDETATKCANCGRMRIEVKEDLSKTLRVSAKPTTEEPED